MMPTTMLLKPYSRSFSPTTGRTETSWPTMYDLPCENPEDPGLPDVYHDQQPQLLKEIFQPPAYPSDNVFVAADLNLYYDRSHDHWYKRPDWLAIVGVSHLHRGRDQRLSYVVWDEKVIPSVVVELLSPGTEDEDLGRTSSSAKGPPTKWDVYEKILQIPYYVVFSRYTNKVQLFELIQGRYVKLPPTTKTLWIPKLQLGLGGSGKACMTILNVNGYGGRMQKDGGFRRRRNGPGLRNDKSCWNENKRCWNGNGRPRLNTETSNW